MKLIISDICGIEHGTDDVLQIITNNDTIRPCIGCFGCWVKTPGECVIKDGYEKTGALMGKCTELVIISRCVYGCYSPFVKNVLDRGLSYISPHFTVRSGELHHKQRYCNNMSITVYFYGDVTDTEKQSAQRIVSANALNFCAAVAGVEFLSSADEARRVLA